MRVYEVARELNVTSAHLIQLLRDIGVPVRTEASSVDDATVAKLRARFERERRAGQTPGEPTGAGDKDATGTPRRRRRRRRVEEVEAAPVEPSSHIEAEAVEATGVQATSETTGEDTGPETEAPPSAEAETTEEERLAPEVEAVSDAESAPVEVEPTAVEKEPAIEAEAEPEEEPEPEPVVEVEDRPTEEPEPEPEPVAEAEAEPEPVSGAETKLVAEAEQAEEPEPEPAAEAVVEPDTEAEPEPEPVAEADTKPEEEPEAAPASQEEAPEPAQPPPTPARPPESRPKPKPVKVRSGRKPRPGAQAPVATADPAGQVRIQAEGFTPDGRRKKDRRKKKKSRVDQGAVQENIQRVMAELKGKGKKRRRSRVEAPSRQERAAEQERRAAEEAETVRVNEFLTVAELADLIDRNATDIISSAFKNLGLMVTINQRLDFAQIELLLEEFGFRAVREQEYGGESEEVEVEESQPDKLTDRPPVVTVMGHVDHGKTRLLDYIRKTNVVAGEAGGITQHIGAYHVQLEGDRSITFLDTPGHAAFTAMRARGADATDIVVLVVAADDSVMPQTVEAISHARNAGVPIVVAVNKVDLPTADPGAVLRELLQHGITVEEFGGDVLSVEVSAKTGHGMPELLEKILLQAEMLEISADADRPAQGVVIEAQLDVGKGPVATVLVTNGTLRIGAPFVCGLYDGRVRALLDERGNQLEEVGPGCPAQILGMAGVPQAGDTLVAMDAVRAAEIARTRQRLDREKQLRIKGRGMKLTDLSHMLAEGSVAQLNLIIKADMDGSVQALSDALEQLSTSEVKVEVIHRGVGAVNESDVLLATTANAIIIGFHVRPDANARAVAAREGVDIRLYSIIYEAAEDIRAALEGLLQPEEKETLLGVAEVRQLFKVPRVGNVAGCYVTEGIIRRRAPVRVVRDGVQVYQGELGSLKRFKDDVREVREGFECGLNISGYNDIKVGDLVECFQVESVARTLAATPGDSGDDS